MITVTELARRCGLSRTALLYYESIGLMPPPQRSGGNYRSYTEADVLRLRQIRAWRDAGLKLDDIRQLLNVRSDRPATGAAGPPASRADPAVDRAGGAVGAAAPRLDRRSARARRCRYPARTRLRPRHRARAGARADRRLPMATLRAPPPLGAASDHRAALRHSSASSA